MEASIRNLLPILHLQYIIIFLNEDKSLYRNQAQNLKVYFNPYLEITFLLKGLTFITRAGASLGYSRSNTFTGEGLFNGIRQIKRQMALRRKLRTTVRIIISGKIYLLIISRLRKCMI